MTLTLKLTERQQEVLDFIVAFKQHNGFCPSVQEIGQALFIGKSTAHRYLVTLQEKGYIQMTHKKIRAIRVIKES